MSFKPSNHRQRMKRRRRKIARRPHSTPTPQAAFGLIAALAQPLIPKKPWVGLLAKTKQS
jgi:hypothetical protein